MHYDYTWCKYQVGSEYANNNNMMIVSTPKSANCLIRNS